MDSGKKKIAINTAYMYIRTFLAVIVSLFTSRIILEKLGVEDYGIYIEVGGIVGLLGFMNGVLANGTGRFITFELGRNEFDRLKRTFSSMLTAHLLLALVVIVIMGFVGWWLIGHKLDIPANRLDAAYYVLCLSLFTTIFTLTQVPYTSLLIAHERMSVVAYWALFNTFAKLGILYLLAIMPFDKLEVYATLLMLISLTEMVGNRIYCVQKFKESRVSLGLDKDILRPIFSYSSWSILTSCTLMLNGQGVVMLLGMFFSPAIVAARAISLQINQMSDFFVNGFRTAVNPQIIKRYAAGDFIGSKHLLLESTQLSFYLMMIVTIPIFFCCDDFLKVWLKTVPDYTTIFLKIVLFQTLFNVFNTSFYQAINANGNLKRNAIMSAGLSFLQFPIIYVLFRYGSSPIAQSWVALITYFIMGTFLKPYLLVNQVNYQYKEIYEIIICCFKVLGISLSLPLILGYVVHWDFGSPWINLILKSCIIFIWCCMVVFYCGLTKNMRMQVVRMIMSKLGQKKHQLGS